MWQNCKISPTVTRHTNKDYCGFGWNFVHDKCQHLIGQFTMWLMLRPVNCWCIILHAIFTIDAILRRMSCSVKSLLNLLEFFLFVDTVKNVCHCRNSRRWHLCVFLASPFVSLNIIIVVIIQIVFVHRHTIIEQTFSSQFTLTSTTAC